MIRHERVKPTDLPQSALQYVLRTRERVLHDDASSRQGQLEDEYFRNNRPRSVLCLPILKQSKAIGALYLENSLAAHVFTLSRVAVLDILASQAAISLENAALYTDLQLQVGLLQQLPVSAWTLKPDGTPDFVNQVWLDFAGQTLDFVRSDPEAWMTAVHPEDRERAAKTFREGVRSGKGFAIETRSRRARDGTYRWHLQQAVVLRDAEGKVLKFVGTTTDIDDQKRAEEALHQAQAELAHAARVTTMGELAASIAHEVNQPLGAVVTNADACLRWLDRPTPDLNEVRESVRRIIRDGKRGSEVIARIRTLLKHEEPSRVRVDINEAIRAIVGLARNELSGTDLQLNLANELPRVSADRVQLQQVLLNLILNAIESMKVSTDRAHVLCITTKPYQENAVLVTIQDSGLGFQPGAIERLFENFFTTKPKGLGMGLSISRSIVENHGGQLWAEPNDGPGATFLFTLPVESEASHETIGSK